MMKMTRVKFGDKGLLNFSIAPLSLKNIGYFLEDSIAKDCSS